MPSNALCSEIDTLASALSLKPGTRCMPGSASATHIAHAVVAPTSCTIATSATWPASQAAARLARPRDVLAANLNRPQLHLPPISQSARAHDPGLPRSCEPGLI